MQQLASTNAKALALPLLGAGATGWSTSLAAQALVAQVIHAAGNCSLGDEQAAVCAKQDPLSASYYRLQQHVCLSLYCLSALFLYHCLLTAPYVLTV